MIIIMIIIIIVIIIKQQRSNMQRQELVFTYFIFFSRFFFSLIGATTEFRETQGDYMQINRKRLKSETDNNSNFCYSMILK